MKYRIKATNTRTNQTIIMSVPVFTSKAEAQEFADKFVKLVQNAKLEVIESE